MHNAYCVYILNQKASINFLQRLFSNQLGKYESLEQQNGRQFPLKLFVIFFKFINAWYSFGRLTS